MATGVTNRTTSNGTAAYSGPGRSIREYVAPPTQSSMVAQVSAMLATLGGVWVAISPWFLSLGPRETASDLIVGLAIAALGVFGIAGNRGFMGLQAGNALLGTWLIIAPFILAAKFAVSTPMYWSNGFAGAAVVVFAIAALASLRRAEPR